MDVEGLRATLQKHNQEHLLKFWEQLSEKDREQLYKDIKATDLPEVNRYFQQCTADMDKAGEKVDEYLHPLPPETTGSVVRTPEATLKQYEEIGLQQVADSKVAIILLAGGQGTRLGVPYPKGMYDVGLPSHKSLYQLQGERIVKLVENAKKFTGKQGTVPWYIMTSEHTKGSTENFFQRHNYFGLSPNDVMLFEQHMLPCMAFDGKIILEKPHKIARAPNGNGGLYRALQDSGVLDDLTKRNIEYVHCYCVDNILVKMADPVFTGFCISKEACCGAKVVEKAFPTEAVGVVCKVDNRYQVVEYSEITLKTAEKRNADGRLVFNAGNICNHFFTMDFLKQVCVKCEDDLVHHVAKKKIPFTNDSMETVKPESPNGIKMEKFVFDVFRFASNFAVWEVLREDEFAPLKNADGAPKDTPTTSRHALYNLHQRYVRRSGGNFVRKDGTPLPDIARNHRRSDHVTSLRQSVQILISEEADVSLKPAVLQHSKPLKKGKYSTTTNGYINGVTNRFANGFHKLTSNGTNGTNGSSNGTNGRHITNGSSNGLSSHAEDEDETVVCEISPLISSYGEDLDEVVKGKKFLTPLILYKKGEAHQESINTVG